MVKLLVLAISDPIFAAKIHETRIYPPSERTTAERIARLRAVMEAGNALDPATNEGRKNRSRLDLMENDSGLLLDLELEWLSPAERLKNGDWQETSDFMTHPEAEHITAFVLERYRRDLVGRRIAIVMAKKEL